MRWHRCCGHTRCLVVLKHTAQGSSSGRKSAVEHVHKALVLALHTNVQSTRLVIGAVRARNQLLVLLVDREPRLEIELASSSIVQSTGHNVDNSVRKAELQQCDTKVIGDEQMG
jgi:hypothetical protein